MQTVPSSVSDLTSVTSRDGVAGASPQGKQVYTCPPGAGELVLGRTLISLLDESCAQLNPKALNHRVDGQWASVSNVDFRAQTEALALSLLELGLKRGDNVALYTHSDLTFCLSDIACLLAGLVDVPIYLTHPPSAVKHILNETRSRVMFCSDAALFAGVADSLAETSITDVILHRTPDSELEVPSGLTLHTVDELLARGRALLEADPKRPDALRDQIEAQDVATLIYTSGTTGLPKGVMLTHENISSNVIASITGLRGFQRGPAGEVALSFLPLTHVFARTLFYALLWSGTSTYFSSPDTLREDLQEVKPTFFASVPRVLEKAYERILATGASLSGPKKKLFDWALELAQRYRVGEPPRGAYALQLKLADKLVLSKWREALGGRVRQIIVGGAALRADLVNTFAAADIHIMQGYGLTETSPVITFSRHGFNRPGTVGPPLAGAEVRLSANGEILTRGPHVMRGYYRQPEATAAAIDSEGWFHTGDLGEFSEEGFLKITGRLKNLFKLSTGKYVMPQPLEDKLEAHPLIGAALVVGESEKYCAALIFVSPEALAESSLEALEPQLKAALEDANRDLPHWSSVKKAALIPAELTVENGLLTPKMSVKRKQVVERYQAYLGALYQAEPVEEGRVLEL